MLTDMKIALAAALTIATASAALAGSAKTDVQVGFVMPSSIGVNSVYHLDLFGNADTADRAYGFGGSANLPQSLKKSHSH
jgi:hypothetical protein